jgi:hypothetical protein
MPTGYSSALSLPGFTMENQEGVTISAPLFLVSAKQPCSQCGKENKIVAIATQRLVDEFEPEEGDGFLICYAEELPDEILEEIIKRQPSFQKRNSLTAGATYYMSTCECDGYYGDHYVQKQLLNQMSYSPSEVSAELLPVAGDWVVPCGYSQSLAVGEFLEKLI